MWVLAGLAVALSIVGYTYITGLQTDARRSTRQQLSAIADLKLQQIHNWREERLTDARFFSTAKFAAEDISRVLQEPGSTEAKEAVLDWLLLLKGGNRYFQVLVFDVKGELLMGVPNSGTATNSLVMALVSETVKKRQVIMTDLTRDEGTGLIHIDITFPIYERADPQSGRVLAVIFLALDAREFLFPVVTSWPTPSRSAETLLARRDGESVLYLNDVRHREGTALKFRVPANTKDLPSAKILAGETEVIDGIDYRGVPVVAAGHLVPGTSWAIVAKMNRSEVYAPLRERMWMAILILGMVFVCFVLIRALFWRLRKTQFLQRELELERERSALAERLAHLMRHASDIILLVTPDGRIVEANDMAAKSYGYSLEELQHMRIQDLRAPEGRERVDQDLEAVQSRKSIVFEAVHERKNGCRFSVEVSSRMVRIGGEDLVLSILRDISERKAEDEHRKQAEDRMRLQAAALESAANSIVITGPDASIQWVNPAFERLTGYSAEEALGKNPHILNSGKHNEAFFRRMWEVIKAGQVWHGEVTNKRKNGNLYVEEMTITPVKDRDGRIIHYVAVKQDVTERKQAEEALRQTRDELALTNAELERRVAERTAQLQETVAELEAFSYSMSHDLRSPLRAIRSFTSMVLEEQREHLVGEGAGMLQRVLQAAARMDQLVTDVLALGRVSRTQVIMQQVDTERLVRQLIHERPELHPPKAEVLVVGTLPKVLAHEPLLSQCLANLLGNAVKFVGPGVSPKVEVSAATKGGLVRICVKDNGIGIPRQLQERIFEIFQRLHGQEAYEGTGIGLAIVKKAVERIGGRVGVDSDPGKGSTFWVELQSGDE